MRPSGAAHRGAVVDQHPNLDGFLKVEAARYSAFRELFTLVYDIEGALAAQQFGAALDQARRALSAAVDIWLVDIVGVLAVPPNETPFKYRSDPVTWLAHQWDMLNRVAGERSDLLTALWDIETSLPENDDDAREVVERCRQLIEELIDIRLDLSEDALRNLLRRFYDGAEVLAAFKYGGRDRLVVFGSRGYQQVGDTRLYDYVEDHLRRLAGAE